jgi:hypothetical protein
VSFQVSQLAIVLADGVAVGAAPAGLAFLTYNNTTKQLNVSMDGGAAQVISAQPVQTNGQLLIGSTGNAPVAATITAGAGISVTNGAGSITIAVTGGRYNLAFANTSTVPAGGTLQLTSVAGIRLPRGGTITAASIQVGAVDSSRNYNLSIRVNGTEQATVALNGVLGNSNAALNLPVAANDVITAWITRTSGTGVSSFTQESALIEVTI